MWIENFRQFLNHSLQRFADWLRGGELLWARWGRRGLAYPEASLPALEGFGPGEAQFSIDPQHGGWRADLSYRYRSLHCQVQASALELTPGMQRVHRALQGLEEA